MSKEETDSIEKFAEERVANRDQHEREERASECVKAINAVLAKHKCRIVTYLTSENVGTDGAKQMLQAHYGIFADPKE